VNLFGVLFAVAAFFLVIGAIYMDSLKAALNKLEADLDAYIAAGKIKDELLAAQQAEIERLEANQADPAAIDAMTTQVENMDAKLFA
jgi:hypothetical protein